MQRILPYIFSSCVVINPQFFRILHIDATSDLVLLRNISRFSAIISTELVSRIQSYAHRIYKYLQSVYSSEHTSYLPRLHVFNISITLATRHFTFEIAKDNSNFSADSYFCPMKKSVYRYLASMSFTIFKRLNSRSMAMLFCPESFTFNVVYPQ